jgi:hypothetical protein
VSKKFLVVVVLLGLLLSGCGYINHTVNEGWVGARINSGKLQKIVPPGRYNTWPFGFFTAMENVNVSPQVIEWEDASVGTKDKQTIGVRISVTYRRDANKVDSMWREWNLQAKNDEALAVLVRDRIPGAVKALTTRWGLDDILGTEGSEVGRDEITDFLETKLTSELSEFYTKLENVVIDNIEPSPQYIAVNEERAVEREKKRLESDRRDRKELELETERAQTEIAKEIATREQEIAAIKAKTFELSPEALELERLRIQVEALKAAKVVFLPADTTLFLSGSELEKIIQADQ